MRHPVTLLILTLGLYLTPSAFAADTDADKSAVDRFIQYTMEATGGKDRPTLHPRTGKVKFLRIKHMGGG
jgi:hypothetical protein